MSDKIYNNKTFSSKSSRGGIVSWLGRATARLKFSYMTLP